MNNIYKVAAVLSFCLIGVIALAMYTGVKANTDDDVLRYVAYHKQQALYHQEKVNAIKEAINSPVLVLEKKSPDLNLEQQ